MERTKRNGYAPGAVIGRLLNEMGRGAQRRLAEYLDVSPTNINRWIKEARSGPPEKLKDIARFLGVSVTCLVEEKEVGSIPYLGNSSTPVPEKGSGPIVGTDTIPFPVEVARSGRVYAVSLKDDTMVAPKLRRGDIVICDTELPASPGIAHYTVNEESGIAKIDFGRGGTQMVLQPLNPFSQSRWIDLSDVGEIRIAMVICFIGSLNESHICHMEKNDR